MEILIIIGMLGILTWLGMLDNRMDELEKRLGCAYKNPDNREGWDDPKE